MFPLDRRQGLALSHPGDPEDAVLHLLADRKVVIDNASLFDVGFELFVDIRVRLECVDPGVGELGPDMARELR